MTLKDQIIADMTAAMKTKDALTLAVLRMVKADIMKYEVSGSNAVADDAKVVEILQRGIKQRKEAIEGFKQGGNPEAAADEEAEIVVLERYLPEQMNEEELRKTVQGVVDQLGSGANFGQVMGAVMGKVKGKVDGGMVNRVVKEMLG